MHEPSLVSRLSCGGGGNRAWYTLFAQAPSSLGNLIPLCYTKIRHTHLTPDTRYIVSWGCSRKYFGTDHAESCI